jgi:hypothetical protein
MLAREWCRAGRRFSPAAKIQRTMMTKRRIRPRLPSHDWSSHDDAERGTRGDAVIDREPGPARVRDDFRNWFIRAA